MRKKTDSDHIFDGFVKEVAGAPGLKVVTNIEGGGSTDETIEKASGLKLAAIRSILNQLNYHGIVEYTREKNMQSGWFTYTWKVNKSRALQNFLSKKKAECEQMRKQMNVEGGEGATVYECPKGCGQFFFAIAMDNGFACNKCKAKLKFSEGDTTLSQLETRISSLETILRTPSVF